MFIFIVAFILDDNNNSLINILIYNNYKYAGPYIT